MRTGPFHCRLLALLCSAAGTGLHHLLRASFHCSQNQQLAALLTLWLANPRWSVAPSLPACHWTFSHRVPGQRRAISASASLASAQTRPSCAPPPPLHPSTEGLGGIWGYVNNLMRSKVCESPLLSPHTSPSCGVAGCRQSVFVGKTATSLDLEHEQRSWQRKTAALHKSWLNDHFCGNFAI